MYSQFVLTLLLLVTTLGALAATKNDPHVPISHCYHWLNQASKNYLTFKYDFAKTNGDELTFFTTPGSSNGSVAGPGLYCGKSPADSYSYGDRVIRVDLVDDVVMLDEPAGIKYCGTKGVTSKTSAECAQKTWDIKFYHGGGIGNVAWYVIQNPMAIQSWSANNDVLENDLKANILLNDSSFKAHAEQTISFMNQERQLIGKKYFQNLNARASLIDLVVKDPAKLDSFPPLNVVSRVLMDQSGKLSTSTKLDLYRKFFPRSLKSNDTDFADVEQILSTAGSDLKDIIYQSVLTALRDPAKHNVLVLLAVMSKSPKKFEAVTDLEYQALINQLFTNKSLMMELASMNITFDARVQTLGLAKIRSLKAVILDPKNTDGTLIPTVMKFFATPAELSRLKSEWKAQLFSSQKQVFGVKIGTDSFHFTQTNPDIEGQCLSATALSADAKGEYRFLFRDQQLNLGSTSTLSAQDICKNLSTLAQTISKSNLLGSKDNVHVISGRIQKIPFAFVAQYSDDLQAQCQAFYPSLPSKTSVDEIFVKFNDGAEVRKYNSQSYWKTASEVCAQIESGVSGTIVTRAVAELNAKQRAFSEKNKTLKKAGTSGYLVEGTIQGTEFALFGTIAEDIQTQCLSFVDLLPSKSVDLIYWKIGNDPLKKIYNSQSYWKTPIEICTILKNGIVGEVPTKSAIQRQTLVASFVATKSQIKGGYEVKGKMQGMPYTFFGANRDVVSSQCQQFYALMDNVSVDEILFSVNSAPQQRQYNSSTFWKTSGEVCGVLLNSIQAVVPSAAELINTQKANALILAAQNAQKAAGGKGLLVTGTVENTPYAFFGLTKNDALTQCKNFFPLLPNPKGIDDATMSVNLQTPKTLRNSQSYWSTADSLCGQMGMYLPDP